MLYTRALADHDSNTVTRNALLPFDLDNEETRSILNNPNYKLNEDFEDNKAELIRAALIPAYQRGFRIVFVIGASLAASAFVLTWFLLPQIELQRPDDEKLKEEAGRRDANL